MSNPDVLWRAFRLERRTSSDAISLRPSAGWSRVVRVLAAIILAATLSGFGVAFLDGDATDVTVLLGTVIAALVWYEPYRLNVSMRGQRLTIEMTPFWYGWLGNHVVDTTGVIGVKSWLVFIILTRPSGREFLFVPLPHLHTADGLGANDAAADFIEARLHRPDPVERK